MTFQQIDKQRIQDSFTKASAFYNKHAEAQYSIANDLATMIHRHCPHSENILEIGCGTGLLTRKMLDLYSPQKVVLNDLVKPDHVLKQILEKRNIHFLEGDAENIDFQENFDLIISASTFQWFGDLPSFLKKCYNHLNDNGYIAFSTFSEKNLYEMKSLTGIGLQYVPLEKILAILKPHFEVMQSEEKQIIKYFKTPKEALKHLSYTGVTGIQNFTWTPQKYRDFSDLYISKYGDESGVHLTYTPLFIIARKK